MKCLDKIKISNKEIEKISKIMKNARTAFSNLQPAAERTSLALKRLGDVSKKFESFNKPKR